MNLFRSEEHVKSWSQYDPVSEEAILLLADWALVFSGPLFRDRLKPDYLSHTEANLSGFLLALQKLGKTGPFWSPD